MKKKNLNSLKLNKKVVSKFSTNTSFGGRKEESERRTNCPLCGPPPPPVSKVYSCEPTYCLDCITELC